MFSSVWGKAAALDVVAEDFFARWGETEVDLPGALALSYDSATGAYAVRATLIQAQYPRPCHGRRSGPRLIVPPRWSGPGRAGRAPPKIHRPRIGTNARSGHRPTPGSDPPWMPAAELECDNDKDFED